MKEGILICLFLLLSVYVQSDSYVKQVLRNDWRMEVTAAHLQGQKLYNHTYATSMPATIHLVLERHKEIPEPFYSNNNKELAWVSQLHATFSRNISMSEQLKNNKFTRATLVFEGIDTFSTIKLNKQILGTTENAFLKYEFQIFHLLKVGDNLLQVELKPSKENDARGQREDKMPFQYAHTRKPCYQYSWDWAPYMNTIGIWQPVSLLYYNEIKLDYIWLRNKVINQNKAIVEAIIALDMPANTVLKDIEITIKFKGQNIQTRLWLTGQYSTTELLISDPKLWWPNNIGDPHVYDIEFTLFKNGQMVDKKTIVYGIRTVQLDDSQKNFKVIINGYPIYCKGSNYVPPDMMYPRIINSDYNPRNTYKKLLDDAVRSNFNMLRVWGGGQYEVDEFYELASRKGIMIFQDFMFSDSIYPSTDPFLINVRKEVIYQVRRLRNYPCLTLWSGNNQILQGIMAWGWGKANYIQDYAKIFKDLIPSIIHVQSKYIPYIQSSPTKGVGNGGFQRGGDIHYWGVWAAGFPFQNYENAIGGFNSQFGTQSLPVWDSIKQFVPQEDRKYASKNFEYHERHASRFITLLGYMKKYAHQSLNFEMQSYASGLVQAYAIEIAIKAQRLAKPVSFGTLYWQFNDAWPAISWSSIDYYGRWKPLQFTAKLLFNDIILLYHKKTEAIVAINDKLVPITALCKVYVMYFNGKIIFQHEQMVQLQPNQKKQIVKISPKILKEAESQTVIYTEIIYGSDYDNKTQVTTFLKPLKELQIDSAKLMIRYMYENNEILVWSSYLIKNLFISNKEIDLELSDNYFDVVPNIPKKVKILNIKKLKEIEKMMEYKSYRQVYNEEKLTVEKQQ